VVVAWYKVNPVMAPQLVTGTTFVADVQTSLVGCAHMFFEYKLRKKIKNAIRLKAGSMVLKGFWILSQ
jgi:hypothetical protein